MPQQNLLSFSIPESDQAEITAAISTLRAKLLPNLRTLKPEERMGLLKMGDRTSAFVKKALEHCEANPELSPQYLDIREFNLDVSAVDYLRSVYAPLLQITDSLCDTMMLAGSDAYAAALLFYTSVRTAQKSNIAKAGTIYDDLAARFPGRSKARIAQEEPVS